MYSNSMLNFQYSTTGNLLNAPRIYIYIIYIYIYIYIYIRDAFNKFSEFFVQAFEIVILLKIQ